ncbi:uncharacterized protein LOC142236499 [Haematobia irritans]|uniref:uncharacterized protein LOC142236499 n=1 Tax=Haematobia irritans TaxID=7368 RepID=UPI003F4F6758
MPAKIKSSPSVQQRMKSLSLKEKSIQKKDSINYALYLHCEELRKRRTNSSRVSRTKLLLTHELISKTVKNIEGCTAHDLLVLSRETIFKKNLQRQMMLERQNQRKQMVEQQKYQHNGRSLQRTSSFNAIAKQLPSKCNERRRSLKF